MILDKILSNKNNLERVLDNLREGIIAHDLNRRILFFNREAEKITGYTRSEVIGRDCHNVFGTALCGDRCSFCSGAVTLDDAAAYPLTITTRSGDLRRVDMTVTPMTDEHGDLFGVLASFKDETELIELKLENRRSDSFASIIGCDPKMLQVFQQIRRVAEYDYPVHISGETGTGKELVAAAIHSESHRRKAPFVPINSGALPEGLIESELFGHVKGAFSGAVREKKGRFELADTGTVFLDEIADISKAMQVKLLRFLQEGTFEKVGGETPVSVDVRIISATNRSLKQEVREGRFREDLFYRLNVIPLHLPPLRERCNDIPLLAAHFLKEAETRYGRPAPRLSRQSLALLMDYHWPGNVRELQNAVQFAIVKCRGGVVSPDDLPMEIRRQDRPLISRRASRKLDISTTRDALRKTGGNKSRAARLLGVGRATLYRFLAEFPEIMTEE